MGLKSRIALAIGLLITLVIFQNCGKMSSSNATSSSGGRLSNDSDGELEFFKGQPYDPSLVPYTFEDPSLNQQIQNFKNRTGFKTMAFTQNGDLYISSSNDTRIENQADWDEASLERCQLFFMNKPCALFASGDLIAQDKADFLNDFGSKITVPALFRDGLVPSAINFWQNYHLTDYASRNNFNSFAIGRNGGTHAGWSADNQAEATRRAMEFCEAISDLPCTLYAEGLTVVFDLNDYQWDQKRITYGPAAFNVDTIPFIPDTARETIRTQYNQGFFFALAMDRYGVWESLRSSAPIVQADLDDLITTCNAKVPVPAVAGQYQRQCFIYSVDAQVVMTRASYMQATYGP